jgi:hypothetical protein
MGQVSDDEVEADDEEIDMEEDAWPLDGVKESREERVAAMAEQVSRWGRAIWQVELPEERVLGIVTEAFEMADVPFNAEVAAEWGRKEFPEGIPREIVSSHEAELAEHGDFERMARARFRQLHDGRLNKTRVESLSKDNPEREKVLELTEGIVVETDPEFVPNGNDPATRPPLRALYTKAHKAVDKLVWDMVAAGLAVIFGAATAFGIPGLHLIPAHWAPKQGKACGRAVIDATAASSGRVSLNSKHVSDWATTHFGELKHPTIVEIITMIWQFRQQHPEATWADICLFRVDLRGAYNLLSIRAEYCKWFAVELVGDLVVVFLAANFGWAALPAAFGVITRAIVFELARRLTGRAVMYVDDIIGCTLRHGLTSDIERTTRVCTDLLGENAVSTEKTVTTEDGGPRRMDAIGYTIDVDQQIVTLTRRNMLKTLYAMFSFGLDESVPVSTIQRVASLASRYSMIVRELKPFTRAIYANIRGLRSKRVSVALSDEARLSIQLWRTMLCALALDEQRFARPLASFVTGGANWVLQFDASLEGIGFIVSQRDPATGNEVAVGGGVVPLDGLELGEDSSFQNFAEFLAIVVGVIAVVRCQRERPTDGGGYILLELRGDSTSALTWAETTRFRSDRATRAAVVFVLCLVRLGVVVVNTVHVPGEENVLCDKMSRKNERGCYRSVQEVLPGLHDLMGQTRDVVPEVIRLCDPRQGTLAPKGFEAFWVRAAQLVASV